MKGKLSPSTKGPGALITPCGIGLFLFETKKFGLCGGLKKIYTHLTISKLFIDKYLANQ